MFGPFDFFGVNILEVLSILLLAAVAVIVLVRGRGAPWAVFGAGGFGLLAATRLGSVVLTRWYVWSTGASLHDRIRIYQWLSAGLWLVATVALGLIAAAVLVQRSNRPSGLTPTSGH